MADALRNFRLDDDRWNAFKQAAGDNGASASAELARMIDLYLQGAIPQPDGKPTVAPVTDQIEAAIAPIRDELAELRAELGKFAA